MYVTLLINPKQTFQYDVQVHNQSPNRYLYEHSFSFVFKRKARIRAHSNSINTTQTNSV